MKIVRRRRQILSGLFALLAVVAFAAASCGDDGVAQEDYDAVQAELTAAKADLATAESGLTSIQDQMDSMAPVTLVQAGQLAPAPASASGSAWDTDESIRGGLTLFATYDSSGPDAWDPTAHPLIYMTSEGTESSSPSYDEEARYFVGFHLIDAYEKNVVAAFVLDEPIIGDEINRYPHGTATSPDGKWGYFGWSEAGGPLNEYHFVGIVNMRTLKFDKVLTMSRDTAWDITGRRAEFGTLAKPNHHVQSFIDYAGNDRVILQMGFGARGGPHYILDPKDDNRVWKSITFDEVHPMGHPFTTPSPDGQYLYISMGSSVIQSAQSPAAGIAKLNLETGEVIVIDHVGHHPIGITHTADGKYTYVNDGHGSHTYKIDNETNEVVGSTSSGVAGPYGIVLNWDETELFTVGKGESSHNHGGHLGMIDTATFRQSRLLHRMPIDLGGSASSVDHAILHPDPTVNELWVSNMNGWETIVLDLDTYEPTDWIATPNGGNTHLGAFVRYQPDWSGELLSDMGGPKAESMWAIIRANVAAARAQ